MTVLCDIDIEAIAKGGAINPYDSGNLQPASYDVTLSDVYRTMPEESRHPMAPSFTVDPFDQETLDRITERHVANSEGIIIKPRQFILTGTVERVSIPPYIVGRIEGRSSLGRLGLAVHITAGYLDPGFSGTVTLECANLSPHSIKLTPGMRIAQISFHRLTKYARQPYRGRYQGDTEVQPSRYGQDLAGGPV